MPTQSSADPEPSRDSLRQDPKQEGAYSYAVNGALLKKSRREDAYSPLAYRVPLLTAYIDLHSDTANAPSCFGLSLPHLYSHSQAGGSYINPS